MKFSVSDLAARYYEDGLSANQVASEFRIGASTVRRQLQAAGFKLRTNSESQSLAGSQRDKRIAEIAELYYDQHLGAGAIEKLLGISHSTVLTRLRKAGFKLRTQPRSLAVAWRAKTNRRGEPMGQKGKAELPVAGELRNGAKQSVSSQCLRASHTQCAMRHCACPCHHPAGR
jgi:transposase-like protein